MGTGLARSALASSRGFGAFQLCGFPRNNWTQSAPSASAVPMGSSGLMWPPINIGPKLAQISLHFGVNDIDGTVVEEKITHAAGAQAGQEMTVAELVAMIRQAGRIPVERDTLYNVVREWPDTSG